MIVWLLKSIACSGLLLLVYRLLLEKESMHTFKRVYLLLALPASFLFPLVTLPARNAVSLAPIATTVNNAWYAIEPVYSQPAESTYIVPFCTLIIYILICGLLLYRFAANIIRLLAAVRSGTHLPWKGAILVLTHDGQPPHSFLNYIILHKESFENNHLDNAILRHELAHVEQGHSIDVLCIELLLCLAWWNPFFYLYRRAIRLNHEFLADASVLNEQTDIRAYQSLLLTGATVVRQSQPVSTFHYSITRKRLIMMTRKTPAAIAALKKFLLAPVTAAVCCFVFSNRSDAQQLVADGKATPQNHSANATDTIPHVRFQFVGSTAAGITPQQMEEYGQLGKDYKHGRPVAIKEKMESLFRQMTPAQQAQQRIAFVVPPPPLPRIVPTATQLNAWQDTKTYGVWIDNKKTDNAALANYSNTDFEQVFISRLSANARHHDEYAMQVDLMTKDYYREYRRQAREVKSSMIYTRPPNKDEGNRPFRPSR